MYTLLHLGFFDDVGLRTRDVIFQLKSEFRKRLIEGGSKEPLPNRILEQLREKELIKGHKRQRTDSTQHN